MLKKDKLYIVGAGRCGEILGKYFDKQGISWVGYVDKRSSIQQVNGMQVQTYRELSSDDGYYVISTYQYKDEIAQDLMESGIVFERIIIYDNQDIFYDFYDELAHWRKYTERIKEFIKKHDGKRCFIIGNGPSLKMEDLNRLKKEVTFASNAIYTLYESTDWRPTYYCATDPIFCKEMMSEEENMKILMNGCEAAFTSILCEGMLYKDNPDMERLYYMRVLDAISDDGYPLFSINCDKQVYKAATVTYAMLQLAVYMGFKEIYLLGMDFSYSVERHKDNTVIKNNVSNHMYEMEEEEKRFYELVKNRYGVNYIADVDLQLAGYQVTKRYADTHGIKIFNATRGGKLEVFQRVDFDTLF